MELLIFIFSVVMGLVIYLYFQKIKSLKSLERAYYYKRILRNKLQSEANIRELEKIIEIVNGDHLIQTRNGTIDIQKYKLQLQIEYSTDYSAQVLKKIKNNNLKHKDRKRQAKLLIKQSEKLYNIELDIAQFRKKIMKEISCISV